MASPIVRLEQVALRYGQGPEVLQGVSLSLGSGDFHFVIGPTGAGKSSLLRVIGLQQPPSTGRMTVFGRDTGSLRRPEINRLRRRISLVFQDLRLLDHLSALDNVALPLRINGGCDEQISTVVYEILAWLGLSQLVEAKPPELSMGQRQLVAIARAVITRPDLLLCDEPVSHVDDRLARRLMHLFVQLSRLGATVLIATRNADLVRHYPHPVLSVVKGRISGPAPGALAAAE